MKVKFGPFQGRELADVVRYAPDWIVEWYIPALSWTEYGAEDIAEAERLLQARSEMTLEEYDAAFPVRH